MEFGQINTLWLIEAAGVRIGHWGDNGPVTDAIDAVGGASATFALETLGDSMRIVVFEPGACRQSSTRC
jgi:hypothetical protein